MGGMRADLLEEARAVRVLVAVLDEEDLAEDGNAGEGGADFVVEVAGNAAADVDDGEDALEADAVKTVGKANACGDEEGDEPPGFPDRWMNDQIKDYAVFRLYARYCFYLNHQTMATLLQVIVEGNRLLGIMPVFLSWF